MGHETVFAPRVRVALVIAPRRVPEPAAPRVGVGAPAVRLGLIIASRGVPKPLSPVLVTTKLSPPRTATAENGEVLLRGPVPSSVISVAVAVTNGCPAGNAGRLTVKVARP